MVLDQFVKYLETSFYFKDPKLQRSFLEALRAEGSLLKGPYKEPARVLDRGIKAHDLAREYFGWDAKNLIPALIEGELYTHQEKAIRQVHQHHDNVVVATGTASGKTECFLYPILFELYRQYLKGTLDEPGTRALILYPMNALANDQCQRLGEICRQLYDNTSSFKPTFGQYTGHTPYKKYLKTKEKMARERDRLQNELIYREEMRDNPPHILLTNYSMLEFLLIRPDDSPLFDGDMGKHWQFIVLDEAHQYRGANGMEMGMLLRRLKQRVRKHDRNRNIQCVATSATITTRTGRDETALIAKFAEELFGEKFNSHSIVLGEYGQFDLSKKPSRYHAFLRALDGAYLVNQNGKDIVKLNRQYTSDKNSVSKPLEIALCKECGQHYYVGKRKKNVLVEANRDSTNADFGVEYYLPIESGMTESDKCLYLCKRCGSLSISKPDCGCNATVKVEKCPNKRGRPDELEKCRSCGYDRGSMGDPVREIVHDVKDPNSIVATELHDMLPVKHRKILAFADNRQDAAEFTWYAEQFNSKLQERKLLLQAIRSDKVNAEGLSVNDLANRMKGIAGKARMFGSSVTYEERKLKLFTWILREALTRDRRESLEGTGLVQWFIAFPKLSIVWHHLRKPPWSLSASESRHLVGYLLNEFRSHLAVHLPSSAVTPSWRDISIYSQMSYLLEKTGKEKNACSWLSRYTSMFLYLLQDIVRKHS